MHTIARVSWIGCCAFAGSLFGGDDPAAAWWLTALGFAFGCATTAQGLVFVSWMLTCGLLAGLIGQKVAGSSPDYWPFWFVGGVMAARALVPAWPFGRMLTWHDIAAYLLARWRSKRGDQDRERSIVKEGPRTTRTGVGFTSETGGK